MMQHDGEELFRAVKDVGITIQHFAKLMGVSRNTPTRWFEMPVLPVTRLVKAANVLQLGSITESDGEGGHRVFFPSYPQRLHNEQSENAQESQQPSLTDALHKCTIEREEWKTKAYEALDKYAKLLEIHNQILMGQREMK